MGQKTLRGATLAERWQDRGGGYYPHKTRWRVWSLSCNRRRTEMPITQPSQSPLYHDIVADDVPEVYDEHHRYHGKPKDRYTGMTLVHIL